MGCAAVKKITVCLIVFALLFCASCAAQQSGATVVFDGDKAQITGIGASAKGAVVHIRSGGTYTIRGSTESGGIVVDAGGKDVTLVLDGVRITRADSSAIRIAAAGCTTVQTADGTENTLCLTRGSGADACVHSEADLVFTGDGRLTIEAAAKGVESQTDVTIEGGAMTLTCTDDAIHADGSIRIRGGKITAQTEDDAIHADDTVEVGGGVITVEGHEGLEGNQIRIDGGTLQIRASDDGINAGRKGSDATPTVTIGGGDVTIETTSEDADGIDTNGDLFIRGGTVRITANNPFDYDGKAEWSGGAVIVNGKRITELKTTGF